MTTKDARLTNLRKLKFTPITIPGIDEEFFINKEGTIIHCVEEDSAERLYTFNPEHELDVITLKTQDGTECSYSPAELYLITYYGQFSGKIVINEKAKECSSRYSWKIDTVVSVNDTTDLLINGILFKYSKLFDAHCSNCGCIYYHDRIVRHGIVPKWYHYITLNNDSSAKVYRVIYDAWIGISDDKPVVHHKNVHSWDNRISNLEAVTEEEHLRLHNIIGNGNTVYDAETIDQVCKLMSEGIRPAEAARMVGIPAERAVKYRSGSRAEITKKYEYPKLDKYRRAILDEDQVRKLCEHFIAKDLSNFQLAKFYAVAPETIRDIRERKTWTHITKDYEFDSENPVSVKINQNPNNRRNATIDQDMVIKIYDMLHNGVPPKKVSTELGISYHIVRKIRYKLRWVELTDRLDAQYKEREEGSTTIESIAQEKDLSEEASRVGKGLN